jgi:hypothetical protein
MMTAPAGPAAPTPGAAAAGEPGAEEVQLPEEVTGAATRENAAAEQEGALEESLPEDAMGEEGAEAAGAAPAGAAAASDSGMAAQRDAASGAMGAALSEFSSIATQVVGLAAAPVRFAPQAEEREREPAIVRGGRQRRAAVEALAADFLARNAAKIRDLLAFGDVAPARILAVAGTARAAVQAAVERNRAAVLEAIVAERARVQAVAEGAKARVVAEHQLTVESISGTMAAGRAQLYLAFGGAAILLGPLAAAQVGIIEGLYGRYRDRFRQVGAEVGEEAMAVGRRRRDEYLSRRNGESSLLDGPIHDNRLEASADAAMKVADEYRKALVEGAESQVAELEQTKPRDLANIDSSIQRSREILDAQLDQALTAIEDAELQALAIADAERDGLLSAIDGNLTATWARLDEMETLQAARIDAYGERQMLAIEGDAERAVASVLEGITHAAATLEESLRGFVSSASATEAPEEPALQALVADAQRKIDDLAMSLAQQAEGAIAASEQGIAAGGEQGTASVDELGSNGIEEARALGDSFISALAKLASGAEQSFAQLREQVASSAAAMVATAHEGFRFVARELQASFSHTSEALGNSFKTLTERLAAGLRDGLHDIHQQITKHAEEAAAEVQPRWKKIAKVLLVIAVVIVVAVVTVATAGAGLGLLGTIALGTALGAAAGATIQIGSNLIDGKDAFEGVLKAAAVGAIGGAFGALGAAAGAAVANVGLRIGIELGIDVVGAVVGDLAVGNPITLEGILLGTAIGIGAAGAPAALAGLRGLGGKVRGGVRGRFGAAPPRPAPVPRPTARPSVEPRAPAGAGPRAPEAPAVLRHPPAEPRPPGARPEPERPPRTPQEAGQRVARETMEESAEGAAAAARRGEAPEAGPARRPREPEEGASRRGREVAEAAAGTAAKKAAERPIALTAARQIAAANDGLGTPLPVLLGILNALKRRFRWIRRFEAQPRVQPDVFSVWLIASRDEIHHAYRARLRAIQRRLGRVADVAGGQVRGFRNAGEVVERVGNLRNRLARAGVDDAEIGIRGSAVTGASSKGGGFRELPGEGKPSDVDFFFTSPKLEARIDRLAPGAFVSGRLRPDRLRQLNPELADILDEFSEQTTAQIGRKADATLLRTDLVGSLDKNSFIRFGR